MEISSAVTMGLAAGTYLFLFCIISYYTNNLLFRKNVGEIGMFISFGKPLYKYYLKNGIKINFGYVPLGSYITFKTHELPVPVSVDDAEAAYNKRRIKILNLVVLAVIVLALFTASYIIGYDPVKIFKDILSIEYRLITQKLLYKDLASAVFDRYEMYGKYFFLCFVLVVQFIISLVLVFVLSLWDYLGLILGILLLIAYFKYNLAFFIFPVNFYIDSLLTLVISGFIYFLLLRFFIK
ncbi:hypothetical protein [Chryseobacterium sp. 2987]|uniref:hypothetical protein n=1 Tax=Chryseobacterium sp. 2987 TaxID=2817767 RepID=UPI00285C62FD|nr:hypothetical protein [Chryseobacterium sp. 2987]MDR6923023.1 hypothetical protein [Chryseobacterium sp. 2987]